MERDGEIIRDRNDVFGLIQHMNVKRGKVIGHADGFGFVSLEEGGKDWFLSPHEMKNLIPGDKVLVRIKGLRNNGRVEAAIVRILDDGKRQFVGQYYVEDNLRFVVPDDNKINFDIIIQSEDGLQPKPGEMVLVELVKRPGKRHSAIGEIKEIIGKRMAPGMEIEIALRSFELPFTWSAAVDQEISDLSEFVDESDIEGREDLSKLPFVTIDGADARDFDDAVYATKSNHGGWKLYVAIADVSHYVIPDTALDDEGQNRGNSVYFPGEVIPMLPEVLSNGLCSLNPYLPRLVMVAEMDLDDSSSLKNYKFYPAVIQSHARLTYNQVWDYLSKNDNSALSLSATDQAANSAIHQSLHTLYELYKHRAKVRVKRGGIEFETVETQFVFNQQRKIEKIIPTHRNDAHKLIEECMILANVAAARFLLQSDPVGIYRNHMGPSEEKIETLRAYLGQHGLSIGGGSEPQPIDYAVLLNSIKDRFDFEQIQMMMLRSLSRAEYEAENKGHFGLALEAYSHFTSPIRRYPDLILHRLIKHRLSKAKQNYKGLETGVGYPAKELTSMAEQCSYTERRADDATRDVSDWLKCEFMQDKVGLEFTGTVVTVVSFGLFVRLDDIYVEGLVHVSALSRDYYQFDPVSNILIGERSGKRFGIGDSVKIKVINVNLEDRKIDFELTEEIDIKPHHNAKNSDKKDSKDKHKPAFSKNKKKGKFDPKKAPAKNSKSNKTRKKKPLKKSSSTRTRK
jgi:ribonuclease R